MLERHGPSNKRVCSKCQRQDKGNMIARKFDDDCYNCGKPIHTTNDCRKTRKNKKAKYGANVVEKDFDDWDKDDLVVVVIEEVNHIENQCGRFIDIDTAAHVCSNRRIFPPTHPGEGRKLNMRKQSVFIGI